MIAANRISPPQSSAAVLWLPTSYHDDAEQRGTWDEDIAHGGSGGNPSGVRIDPESALQSTVVLACVRVLAASVASLPLQIYRRTKGGGKSVAKDLPLYRILHSRPNAWQTSYEWRETCMLHLLTYGNAYSEVVGFGSNMQLIPLHPSRMKVARMENGRLRYVYREPNDESTPYDQDETFHVRWLSDDGVNGMVPVELARDAIGLARACEIHGAAFFGNGASPGQVLVTDGVLDPETIASTRENWDARHKGVRRSGRTALLQGGIKPFPMAGTNQEAQFLEARRFQIEEICRIFGVPPHLVSDLTRSSFSNIEQQSLDYLQNGLMPWLRRFESAITRSLLDDPSEETFVEFDVRGVLRADAAARAAFYQTMSSLGVFSVNDICDWENLNPVEGGDARFVPLNMQTLAQANAATAEAVAPAAEVAGEPSVAVADAAAPQVADVSLNGAQVTGIIAILAEKSAGRLTSAAAKLLITSAYPSLDVNAVAGIVDGAIPSSQLESPPEPVS